jgi:hypothetical protein
MGRISPWAIATGAAEAATKNKGSPVLPTGNLGLSQDEGRQLITGNQQSSDAGQQSHISGAAFILQCA